MRQQVQGGVGRFAKRLVLCSSVPRSFTMQTSSSEAQRALRWLVPPLTEETHKGQLGRVGVLGGSPDYTGAPFFSGMAALRSGTDLAYIFTAVEAAPPIKGYSPELMVTPVYSGAWPDGRERGRKQMVDTVGASLGKLHSLVVGPGLGRDDDVLHAVEMTLFKAREAGLPVVIDADGLFLLTRRLDAVRGFQNAVLTPNLMEFKRLWAAVGFADEQRRDRTDGPDGLIKDVERLASALGHVTVVLKHRHDVVTDGRRTLICGEPGGRKRCGGLGDVLSGVLGTTMAWSALAAPVGSFRRNDGGSSSSTSGGGIGAGADSGRRSGGGGGGGASTSGGGCEAEGRGAIAEAGDEPSCIAADDAAGLRLWAAWWACAISKRATREAYDSKGRAMSAVDAIERLGGVVEGLVPAEGRRLSSTE
ncbi:unnamed protein product [Phaeothamnion confervicola]